MLQLPSPTTWIAWVADEHARSPDAGFIEVAGVRVGPPVTEAQAEQLDAAGLLVDTPAGFRDAWLRTRRMWAGTIEDARTTPELLGEQASGEWSFIETLRHLLFVTDGWITRGVAGREDFHPLGIPPHFLADAPLPLDRDAQPSLKEVLDAREERFAIVTNTLDQLADADMSKALHPPIDGFTVLGALQVVLFEELAHHHFATRDLAKLRGR